MLCTTIKKCVGHAVHDNRQECQAFDLRATECHAQHDLPLYLFQEPQTELSVVLAVDVSVSVVIEERVVTLFAF